MSNPILKFRAAHRCQNGHIRYLYWEPAEGGTATKFYWGERKCSCPTGEMGEGFSQVGTHDQFSGYVDKNKNEIYDKDYLAIKNKEGVVMAVLCRRGIFERTIGDWSVDISGFALLVGDDAFASFPIKENYAGVHDLSIMELVGNAYEGFTKDFINSTNDKIVIEEE